MKKILTSLTLTLLLAVCFTFAASALTEGDWEFQLLDGEITVTLYNGTAADIVIPSSIMGMPVTKVDIKPKTSGGKTQFDHAHSITFPDTVISLGHLFEAGRTNKELETVVLPKNLETIPDYLFQGCASLKNVTLPTSLKTIGRASFRHCDSLTELQFPATLEKIGYECFTYSGIERVDLSGTNAVLADERAFMYCKNLKVCKLPDSTVEIPKHSFDGCSSLEYFDFPSHLETIGGYAFSGCSSLTQIILPTSLKKIEQYATFEGCEGLTEVVIPYGVDDMRGCSFNKCPNLKSLYIPDTATSFPYDLLKSSPNCIVYCSQGSKCAEYCAKNSVSYLTDKSVNTAINVYYNGTRISFHTYDQNPELINDRTLVPLRSIFEKMNAEVTWNDATSTAIAKRDGIEIRVPIGGNAIYKNGSAIAVDVPAQLINDRTMIPVRVIAEAFGAKVDWNDAGKTVLITE